jgi:hypothetical protein
VKAEEEVTLLEEQSQHYKDERDKAHREIGKLTASSQVVRYIYSTLLLMLISPPEWLEVAFTGAV